MDRQTDRWRDGQTDGRMGGVRPEGPAAPGALPARPLGPTSSMVSPRRQTAPARPDSYRAAALPAAVRREAAGRSPNSTGGTRAAPSRARDPGRGAGRAGRGNRGPVRPGGRPGPEAPRGRGPEAERRPDPEAPRGSTRREGGTAAAAPWRHRAIEAVATRRPAPIRAREPPDSHWLARRPRPADAELRLVERGGNRERGRGFDTIGGGWGRG